LQTCIGQNSPVRSQPAPRRRVSYETKTPSGQGTRFSAGSAKKKAIVRTLRGIHRNECTPCRSDGVSDVRHKRHKRVAGTRSLNNSRVYWTFVRACTRRRRARARARGDGRILQPRISMDRFATLPPLLSAPRGLPASPFFVSSCLARTPCGAARCSSRRGAETRLPRGKNR